MTSQSRAWRPIVQWSSILLAIFSTIATITFITVLAVVLYSSHEGARSMAVVADALQVLSLAIFSILGSREFLSSTYASDPDLEKGHKSPRLRKVLFVSTIFTSIASIATLVTIIWMGIILPRLRPTNNLQPSSLLACLATTCVVSILSSGTAFFLLFTRHNGPSTTDPALNPVPDLTTDRPTTAASVQSNPFSTGSSPSSRPLTPNSASASASRSLSSLRSSLTLPNNSSRLLPNHPTSERGPSPFDAWDTSTVSVPLRDTVHARATPPRRLHTSPTPLPPIPGSRPTSPARPLDGFLSTSSPASPTLPSRPAPALPVSRTQSPFPLLTPSTESLRQPNPPFASSGPTSYPSAPTMSIRTPPRSAVTSPAPPSPTLTSSSALSSTSLTPPHPQSHPRTYSSTSLADSVSHLGAPTASADDEANIHPLFRNRGLSGAGDGGPVVVSRGTRVTAASIGDALGVGMLEGRSRKGSLEGARRMGSRESLRGGALSGESMSGMAGKRAVGVASPTVIQATSPLAKEFGPQAILGAEGDEEEKRDSGYEGGEKSARESSEAEKEKPTIPDFVLGAGKRGSFLGFERRKSTKGAN